MIIIYKLSIDNIKECYIGSTKRSIHERLLEHKRPGNRCISRNLCKLGNIKIQVLEQCDANARDEREQYWIRSTPGAINKTIPNLIQGKRVERVKKPSSNTAIQKALKAKPGPSLPSVLPLQVPLVPLQDPFSLLPFL